MKNTPSTSSHNPFDLHAAAYQHSLAYFTAKQQRDQIQKALEEADLAMNVAYQNFVASHLEIEKFNRPKPTPPATDAK